PPGSPARGRPRAVNQRGTTSAGDERKARVGAPLGQRAVVETSVVAAGQGEREQVDRGGDAAAAVGDDRLVRTDAAAVEGGGKLGGRPEAAGTRVDQAVPRHVDAGRDAPRAAV